MDTENAYVFIAQNGGKPSGPSKSFTIDDSIQYHPFRDDFGPMNLSSTTRFIEQLGRELAACERAGCRNLVYAVDMGRRPLSNAAMLYMMLVQDMTPDQVMVRFAGIRSELFESFKDATLSRAAAADFSLTLS
jgi:hypothetical protein